MPKLAIKVDLKFDAGPMSSHDSKSSMVKILSSAKLKKMITEADVNDFSLSVAFLHPEHWYPIVGFEMDKKLLKTGGIFEFLIDEKTSKATVSVKGTLFSAPMRSGVAPYIQKMGKNADLRLVAFNYKGGEWKGFTAPIAGQKEDDFKNWIEIKDWQIK